MNLTDAVILLEVLFVDGTRSLPCEGMLNEPGGNRTLLDFDVNAAVDLGDAVAVLNYLFLDGAPPELGTACVRIVGCPERCGG